MQAGVRMRRAGAIVLAMAAAFVASEAAADTVYTVAKLSVDVTAKDAVAAKAQALADAEERALRTVLKRVAPFGSQDRLPRVKPDLVEDMLAGFSVRSEAISARRYIATLDFQFQPDAVKQLLRGHGIPFADEQSPPLKVLPVFLKDGKVQVGPGDVWRAGWLKLDLAHAVTPVQLLQPGSSLSKETIEAMLAGDAAALRALAQHYAADRLVLAVAEVNDGRLATRLYGVDSVGGIDLVRSDRVFGGEVARAADQAALVALRVLEGRWKIGRSPAGVDGDTSEELKVSVAVEFSGLRQWQDIRARLSQIPGVQSLSVDALSARAASVTFAFAGGADRLQQQLAQRNLALEDRGGTWVLRSN